jgi:hypothetical protein
MPIVYLVWLKLKTSPGKFRQGVFAFALTTNGHEETLIMPPLLPARGVLQPTDQSLKLL